MFAAIRIEAKDVHELFTIQEVRREDDALVLVTDKGVTLLVGPIDELATVATDLL